MFLHDPNFKVPFRISWDATDNRYLTGADFDLESIQRFGDSIWIGGEFGPYLIEAGLDGRIKGVYPTKMDGNQLKSADTPGISATSVIGKDWAVPRSGGY